MLTRTYRRFACALKVILVRNTQKFQESGYTEAIKRAKTEFEHNAKDNEVIRTVGGDGIIGSNGFVGNNEDISILPSVDFEDSVEINPADILEYMEQVERTDNEGIGCNPFDDISTVYCTEPDLQKSYYFEQKVRAAEYEIDLLIKCIDCENIVTIRGSLRLALKWCQKVIANIIA